MAQYVCRYRKGEELRWIGHLDLKRTLERALRRAQLPLELSQGHNPHPKLSYGPPMPLGATGESELFSLSLSQALTAEEVTRRLNEQLPPSFEVIDAWVVPGYKKKETFGELDIAEYVVTLPTVLTITEVRDRLGALLAQEELIVSRQGEHETRELDVRPMILSLSAEQVGEGEVAVRTRRAYREPRGREAPGDRDAARRVRSDRRPRPSRRAVCRRRSATAQHAAPANGAAAKVGPDAAGIERSSPLVRLRRTPQLGRDCPAGSAELRHEGEGDSRRVNSASRQSLVSRKFLRV